MGAVLHLSRHDRLSYPLQLLRGAVPAALNCRLAGHRVKQFVPGCSGVSPAAGEQGAGQFLQGGRDVFHVHIKGGLTDGQIGAQLIHLKAELL